jgi:hypothetical protein
MTNDKPRPSEVRALILAQHEALRVVYAELDALLISARRGDAEGERTLRERCRGLYQMLLRHMATEDAFLAPALREADGFGSVRADELLREHDRQRRLLRYVLSPGDGTAVALTVAALLQDLRADMAHEEHALLDPDLLKDDPVDVGVCTA